MITLRGQEFKVILGSIVSLKLAWATWGPLCLKTNKTPNRIVYSIKYLEASQSLKEELGFARAYGSSIGYPWPIRTVQVKADAVFSWMWVDLKFIFYHSVVSYHSQPPQCTKLPPQMPRSLWDPLYRATPHGQMLRCLTLGDCLELFFFKKVFHIIYFDHISPPPAPCLSHLPT